MNFTSGIVLANMENTALNIYYMYPTASSRNQVTSTTPRTTSPENHSHPHPPHNMSSPTTSLSSLTELFASATEPLEFIRISKSLPDSTFQSSQLKFLLAHARLTRWAHHVKLHDDKIFAVPELPKGKMERSLKLLGQLTTLGREMYQLEREAAKGSGAYFEPEDLQGIPRFVYDRLALVKSNRMRTPPERMISRRKWAVRIKSELDELHRKIALVTDHLEKTIPLAPMDMAEFDEGEDGERLMMTRSRAELQAMANRDVREMLATPGGVEDEKVKSEKVRIARLLRDEAQEVDGYVYQVAYNMVQTLTEY